MQLTNPQIRAFQQAVLSYYKAFGRHTLPWRTEYTTPYHTLVSEVMLQQTQVDRVVPKFLAFATEFPTVYDLASAPQSAVIKLWSGLGYNRRARFLHLTAQKIVNEHNGQVPNTAVALIDLPGIGPYIAAAILAFAYNQPTTVIETNIRTAYIHHFFSDQAVVTDRELLPLIESTIDTSNPRVWYSALMDYGTYLKSTVGNLTRKSKSYTKQSKFAGSDRELRGAILRELSSQSPQPIEKLTNLLLQKFSADPKIITKVLHDLQSEKFISIKKSSVSFY